MTWEALGTLLGMLLAVVAVLCLAYFATRFLAGKGAGGALGRFTGRSRNLQVLERIPLGREQFLTAARAGERYFLLGVTPSSVTLLRELDAEEADALWPETLPEDGGSAPAAPEMKFQDALKAAIRRKKE